MTTWAEPREWNRVLLHLAKKNSAPKPWIRFIPFIFVGIVVPADLIWDWLKPDRKGLLLTAAIVVAGTLTLVFGALYLFHRVKMKYFPTRVWIHENGIEMGDLLGGREWNGFSEMEGFYFDSDTIEGRTFRSLYWLPEGAQYPDSAVVPPEIDEGCLRAFLLSKGLEELERELEGA